MTGRILLSKPVLRRAATAAAGTVAAAHPADSATPPSIGHSIGATLPIAAPDRDKAASARPNRTGLPDRLKDGVEALSGIAMDDVRVYRHSPLPRAIGALAYARGSHIHLARGQEHHLPHEAWHVVQQKQGRVRPTLRLESGEPVNDHAGLEREADTMGARAAGHRIAARAGTPATVAVPVTAIEAHPLQAMWVIRGGQWVWDPKGKQQGDTDPPTFKQRPRVVIDKGVKAVSFDAAGAQTTANVAKPPKYPALAGARFLQGQQLAQRLKDSKGGIGQHVAEIKALADQLELSAKGSVPANHADKIKNIQPGAATNDNFRDIIKGQDELTQASASSSFLNGLADHTAIAGISAQEKKDLAEYHHHAFRLMSSLRAPTHAIYAAVNESGRVIGQQHPSDDSNPVLEQGRSNHNYNDRTRVAAQVATFNAAIGDANAPPNKVFLAATYSAALSTMHGMAAPATASNLASFNVAGQQRQLAERERIKDHIDILGSALDIAPQQSTQAVTAPWRAHETPTSPRRVAQSAAAPPSFSLAPPLLSLAPASQPTYGGAAAATNVALHQPAMPVATVVPPQQPHQPASTFTFVPNAPAQQPTAAAVPTSIALVHAFAAQQQHQQALAQQQQAAQMKLQQQAMLAHQASLAQQYQQAYALQNSAGQQSMFGQPAMAYHPPAYLPHQPTLFANAATAPPQQQQHHASTTPAPQAKKAKMMSDASEDEDDGQ